MVDVHPVPRLGEKLMGAFGRRPHPRHPPSVARHVPFGRHVRADLVVPEFVVARAGHPNVHAVVLQPRHPSRPLGAHPCGNVPLPFVGKPMGAVILGPQCKRTPPKQQGPCHVGQTGHLDENKKSVNATTPRACHRLYGGWFRRARRSTAAFQWTGPFSHGGCGTPTRQWGCRRRTFGSKHGCPVTPSRPQPPCPFRGWLT